MALAEGGRHGGEWASCAMLIGALVVGCGCGEDGAIESKVSMFYVDNASTDTIVAVVQKHDPGSYSPLSIPPGLSRLIAIQSSSQLGFPRPKDALACVSVYTDDGALLTYQQYPVNNASWSEAEAAQVAAYNLTVTNDSLDLAGIPDNCGR